MRNSKKMLRKCLSSTKASYDVIMLLIWPALIFIVIFVIVLLYTGFGIGFQTLNSTLDPNDKLTPSLSQAASTNIKNGQAAPSFFDWGFVILVFGFWIVLLISSFILGNNVIFIIIYFVMIPFMVLIGWVISFLLSSLASSDALRSFFSVMPRTLWICQNYSIISIVFIVTIGLLLYYKNVGMPNNQASVIR